MTATAEAGTTMLSTASPVTWRLRMPPAASWWPGLVGAVAPTRVSNRRIGADNRHEAPWAYPVGPAATCTQTPGDPLATHR